MNRRTPPDPEPTRCQNTLPSGERCGGEWDGQENWAGFRACEACRDEADRIIRAAVAVIVAKANEAAKAA